MAQADIQGLEIDDDSTIGPAQPLSGNWLCYGDSITQGMTAPNPTETSFARVCLALNLAGINLGVGGARLTPDLATTVPVGDYDIISIAYGTNDFNQDVPAETFAECADKLISSLTIKHPRSPIVLITPLTWAERTEPNKLGLGLNDYRAALSRLADKHAKITLLAGDSLIPDDAGFFVDKVHPNARGFELYANKLAETFRKVLKA